MTGCGKTSVIQDWTYWKSPQFSPVSPTRSFSLFQREMDQRVFSVALAGGLERADGF